VLTIHLNLAKGLNIGNRKDTEMPALKKVELPTGFSNLGDVRSNLNERNDCTVVAIALTTGLPYHVVHKALEARGRKSRKGAFNDQWLGALADLGFKARRWTSREVVDMIMSYPKKGISGLTTHQPRRFPKSWANSGTLILHSHRHVSACINGEVQDWAINKSQEHR
jgi:hypothetical protein